MYVVLCKVICFYGFPLETTENDMENIIYYIQQSVKGCDYCNNSHFFLKISACLVLQCHSFTTSSSCVYNSNGWKSHLVLYFVYVPCSFPSYCKGELCGLIICFAASLRFIIFKQQMLHGRGKSIARREAINVQLAVLPTNNSINDSTTSPDLPINVFPFFYFSFYTIQERL